MFVKWMNLFHDLMNIHEPKDTKTPKAQKLGPASSRTLDQILPKALLKYDGGEPSLNTYIEFLQSI